MTDDGAKPEPDSPSGASRSPAEVPGRRLMPQPDRVGPARPFTLDDREKKLVIHMERRVMNIIRQETGDSYAGLPADHVLISLHERFPEVNFPERMMARLEREQQGRLDRERRQDDVDKYEAETRRQDAEKDRNHLERAANRAVGVLVLLLGSGIALTLTGHDAAGLAVLGTTMLGVIGAFLRQQLRGGK